MKLFEDIYKNSPPEDFTQDEWDNGYITKRDAMRNVICKDTTIKDAAKKYFRKRGMRNLTDQRPRVLYALNDVYLYCEYRNGPGKWVGNITDGITSEIKTEPWKVVSRTQAGDSFTEKEISSNNVQTYDPEQATEKLNNAIKVAVGEVLNNEKIETAFAPIITKVIQEELAKLPKSKPLVIKQSKKPLAIASCIIVIAITALGYAGKSHLNDVASALKTNQTSSIKTISQKLESSERNVKDLKNQITENESTSATRHKELIKENANLKSAIQNMPSKRYWWQNLTKDSAESNE